MRSVRGWPSTAASGSRTTTRAIWATRACSSPRNGTPEGTVPPPGAKLTPVDFYSKNPALAQREFSEAVERSPSPSKFRLTSHNVMNPNNKPDAFEDGALREIRDRGLKEYYRAHRQRLPLRPRRLPEGLLHRVSWRRHEGAQRRQGPLRHEQRLRLQGRRRRRHHQREAARALVLGRRTRRWSACGSC